jgi:hypothetical protein
MLGESGLEAEFGEEALGPPRHFPAEAPELCSAEFQASGDLRSAVNPGGTLICYFRSPMEMIGAPDVSIEVAGTRVPSHTISSLGDGVWQSNTLLKQPVATGTPVRLRLGEGEWSRSLPVQ